MIAIIWQAGKPAPQFKLRRKVGGREMVREDMTGTGNPIALKHLYRRRAATLLSLRRTDGATSLKVFIIIAMVGLFVSLVASYFVARKSREQLEASVEPFESGAYPAAEAANMDMDLEMPEQTAGDEARVLGDCRQIAEAIMQFKRDVGDWPMRNGQRSDSLVDYLISRVGRRPKFKDTVGVSWGRRSANIYYLLISNGKRNRRWFKQKEASSSGWNGPYLRDEHADPWGHAYLVSVCGFPGGTKPRNNVWLLSAGPNGIVETSPSAQELRGDDIGLLIR